MTYDAAAFGALALACSILIGVFAFLRWRGRGFSAGFASGIEGIGWTVLPVALWLTGLLRLAVDITSAVGQWAVHLVFSPVVWIGIVLTAGSVGLVLGGRILSRRRGEGPAPKTPGKRAVTAKSDDGMDDIDAILRKHGIS